MASAEEDIMKWRETRDASCRQPDGWLTLAGLIWLKEGKNELGRDEEGKNNGFETPNAPASVGSLTLPAAGSSDAIIYSPPTDGTEVTVDGVVAKEDIPIKTDAHKEGATQFKTGSLLWFVIERNGNYAIRLKDSLSPVLKNFKGLSYFPVNLDFRVKARFEPVDEPKTVVLATAIGEEENKVHGKFVFKIKDQEYSILTFEPPTERSMLMFADQTTKKQTYGGGRYVWVDKIDENKETLLDFNKSYSPPCIFTPYATCSRPPAQNRLAVEVTAGELIFEQE
eukprot:CAMPEP_0201521522 /NCGR_PEP_ID=MMETSP0161_2-20130828/14538_1 /ASSEMBLY_ACC=CAM_ASM_000251 /TAXON_ID=180227 /ORGANISM="Neoparamoeba aestuarina, Strain SoJaBio B1-5/56/2" /LENGTH=281 /DNA_ID=CAMNT_0047920167 /DNA_START=58 /DNA_END=903 /DNA_ORIENTATION=+